MMECHERIPPVYRGHMYVEVCPQHATRYVHVIGACKRQLTLHAPIASAVIGSCAIVDRMNRGEQFPCNACGVTSRDTSRQADNQTNRGNGTVWTSNSIININRERL